MGTFVVNTSRNMLQQGDTNISLEPKVMDVLCQLLNQPGEVITRDELLASVWGETWHSDEGLTRNISILRRLLRSADSSQEYIETIPKKGYRLTQPAVPACKAQQPVAAISPPHQPILAVLAFDNLSADDSMAYLSDGISEEIRQVVAQGTSLKVIGRASSFQYRGVDKAAAHVGKQLGVTHVLDGSVRCVEENIRVSAELIDCANETIVWSQRTDSKMADIFQLEDNIAGAVASALNTTFAPANTQLTSNPLAHQYYLQARTQLDQQFGNSGMLKALPLYEAAVAAAPDFARAWALLAQTRAYVLRGLPDKRPADLTHASVVHAAATALRLDDSCGIAYLALNGLEAWASYNEREAHIHRALAVASNDPEIIVAAANLAARMGRIKVALAYGEKAYALDPMFPIAGFYCTTMMDMDGRYEESRELSDELLERFPDVEYLWSTALSIAAVNSDEERLAKIEEQLRRTGPIDRLGGALLVSKQILNPNRAFIDPYITKAHEALTNQGWVDLRVLNALYKVGACDETFELVEKSSFKHVFDPNARPPGGWANEVMMFNRSGSYPMMRDPRFVNFCTKLGLSDYWVRSGNWPDCADYDFLPYNFQAEIQRSLVHSQ